MESGKRAGSESTELKQVESEPRSEPRSPKPIPGPNPSLQAQRFLLIPHPNRPAPNPRERLIETIPPTNFSDHLDSDHPNPPLRPRKLGFVFCTVILILLTTQFASNIAQTKYFADLVEIESRHENPSVQQPFATCIVNNKTKTLTLICKNAETRKYSLRHLDLDTCDFGE